MKDHQARKVIFQMGFNHLGQQEGFWFLQFFQEAIGRGRHIVIGMGNMPLVKKVLELHLSDPKHLPVGAILMVIVMHIQKHTQQIGGD
jgi:hypothetical protein